MLIFILTDLTIYSWLFTILFSLTMNKWHRFEADLEGYVRVSRNLAICTSVRGVSGTRRHGMVREHGYTIAAVFVGSGRDEAGKLARKACKTLFAPRQVFGIHPEGDGDLLQGFQQGFHGGSDSEESAWKAGDPGLSPGLGRSLGEGNGNPFQYSYLENSMDWEAWWSTVHRITESDTRRSN